jgi:hypothetical protein
MTGFDLAAVDTAVTEAIMAVAGHVPPRDTGFFQAGITSAHVVAIHELVQRSLGRQFPVTAFFRHPSRHAVTQYLAGEEARPAPRARDVPPARPGEWTAQARRDVRSRIRDRQR